ncbi:hypothetical protein SNE40_010621 [Patella caerulea]|uniref:Uncharacterized protein n=1 Tax=Patella caerulea TaxID=87958 RepID=A0AAN8Q587_PATCE
MNRFKKLFGLEDDKPTAEFHDKKIQGIREEFNDKSDELKSMSSQPTMPEKVERTLLKYVPLQEGDCLSCKLISVVVMSGALVYVVRTAIKVGPKQPTKNKRMLFYLQCTVISTVLASIGYARFFDSGIFQGGQGIDKAVSDIVEKFPKKS